MMNKQDLHKAFIKKLHEELSSITEAAQHAISDVTDPEHKARSKYETFSLEASYLARGQSLRVETLREAYSKLQATPVVTFTYEDAIRPGAFVVVMDSQGEEQQVYITQVGGGMSIETPDGPVSMITPASPLGKALMGKKAGDMVHLSPASEPSSILVVA